MSVISNSYSIGRVYASGSTSGAFAGYIDPTFRTYHAGTVTASFWDSVTSGQTSGFGSGSDLSYVDALSQAGGLTTTNMQVLATYNGTANWDIVGDPSLSVNYPQLRWATSGLNAGNSIWVMRGVASSGGGNQTSSDDVERAVTTAIHTPTTSSNEGNKLLVGTTFEQSN